MEFKSLNNSSPFRWFAYLLSQYAWLLIMVFTLICTLIWPAKNPPFLIHSAPVVNKWNGSKNPDIFAHITDTHVTSFNPKTEQSLRRMLNLSIFYNTRNVLLTGDMVDSYNQPSVPKYSNQNLPDWEVYNRTMMDYVDKLSIIDLPGNHDFFGVWSLSSPHSYAFDYSLQFTRNNTKDYNDFVLRYIEDDGYSFIIVNPYTFPAVHTPLMFWAEATTPLLDTLEGVIREHPNSFLLSHYPADMWDTHKSSSGRTFKDICGGEGVRVYLSGHSHPKQPEFNHFSSGGLESIGAAAYQHGVFSIITNDNDRLFFHAIDADANGFQDILISHPIPLYQQSARSAFSEEETEVRALVFNKDKLTTAQINVSGCVTGQLKYQRTINNQYALYSMPLKLSPGKYNITFSGDVVDSFEFVVGETLETPESTPPAFPLSIQFLVVITPIVFIICMIVYLPCKTCSICDGMEEWIQGYDADSTNVDAYYYGSAAYEDESCGRTIIRYIVVILTGPLIIRTRIQKLPLFARIISFILALLPLFLPLQIIETEGHLGFVWSYGYYIGGYNRWANWAWFSSLFYMLIVCVLPMFLQAAYGTPQFRWPMIIDTLVAIAAIGVDIYQILEWVIPITGFKLLFASPGFIICPIICIINMILLTVSKCCYCGIGYSNITEV